MKTVGRNAKTSLMTGVLGIVLALTGCAESKKEADLRVIHASQDAPPVNVRVDNRTVIKKLDYAFSSGYVGVRTGTSSVVVEAIIPGGNADVVTLPAVKFEDSQRYNVLAVNDTADIAALIVSESAAKPGASEVALSVVHASANAGAVDVYVTAPGTLLNGSSPAFTLDYKGEIDAGALPAGPYQIRVALKDEADPDNNAVYDSGTIDLTGFSGQKLLIAALSTVTLTESQTSPIKLLVATDDASLVLLDTATKVGARVLHVSADAGPVDVFATSPVLGAAPVKLIDSIAYTQTFPGNTLPVDAGYSDYAPIPEAVYTFDLVAPAAPANTVADSVYNAQLPLSGGVDYSVVALGNVGDGVDGPRNVNAFGLLPMIDENRAVVTQASVKILHAAPAAELVDVYVTPAGDFTAAQVLNGDAGAPLLNKFAFGTLTDYVAVAPGNYDIRVVARSLGAVAIDVPNFPLTAGLVATVIAQQAEAPTGPFPFGVLVMTN